MYSELATPKMVVGDTTSKAPPQGTIDKPFTSLLQASKRFTTIQNSGASEYRIILEGDIAVDDSTERNEYDDTCVVKKDGNIAYYKTDIKNESASPLVITSKNQASPATIKVQAGTDTSPDTFPNFLHLVGNITVKNLICNRPIMVGKNSNVSFNGAIIKYDSAATGLNWPTDYKNGLGDLPGSIGANSTITIEGSSEISGWARGVYITGESSGYKVELKGGSIKGNSSEAGADRSNGFVGCGIRVDGKSSSEKNTFIMTDGTIQENVSATGGGGIHIAGGGTATISGGSIENNTANSGAGIFVHAGSTLELKGNAKVTQNKIGSGIHIYGSFADAGFDTKGKAVISGNAEISHNTATYGGGIRCRGDLEIGENASIMYNTAGSGGGIHVSVVGSYSGTELVYQSDNPTITIKGGSITNNTSTGNAGAICVDAASNITINYYNGSISGNTANNKYDGIDMGGVDEANKGLFIFHTNDFTGFEDPIHITNRSFKSIQISGEWNYFVNRVNVCVAKNANTTIDDVVDVSPASSNQGFQLTNFFNVQASD